MNCLIIEKDRPESFKPLADKNPDLKILEICHDTQQALTVMAQNNVHLVLADADMPEINNILTSNPSIPVILIGKDESHASEAFDAGATDYLVEPVKDERFQKAVKRGIEKITMQRIKEIESKDLFVRSEYKIVKINYDKVLYVEALADYVVFQLSDNNKVIVHSTMKGVQDKLPADRFVRVHRSYIINRDKIDMIDNQSILMGEKSIPIGAHYRESFYERLNFL